MPANKTPSLVVRTPGMLDYQTAYATMQQFTAARDETTSDEIWFTEHPAVITLGTNAKPEHILDPGSTPVVQTDRGGQVTWHGPGQLMIYILLDLKRLNLTVKGLIEGLEFAAIDCLSGYGITAQCRAGAPGVYTNDRKIASVGVRIRHGRSYHGMSVNVANERDGFAAINPCGYPGLDTVTINDLLATGTAPKTTLEVAQDLLPHLQTHLKLGSAVSEVKTDPWQPGR